jgi:2-dehydropantoate 2-reductase
VVLMRHAVLGVGGIGGLLAGALARSGEEVVLLLRPATLSRFEGRLRIESAVLDAALSLALTEQVAESPVIPLLNGVDHLALLRTRYANVVAGAIRVESEQVSPWFIRQSSPFLRVEMAGAGPVQEAVRAAGIECRGRDDEVSLLWDKLVFLAPLALATTAVAAPFGAVRADARFVGCREEAIAVALAEGAKVDSDAVRALHEQAPGEMRSSMQKDVAAGRQPELDAIAGPIIRGGERHGIPTPNTTTLVAEIRAGAFDNRS